MKNKQQEKPSKLSLRFRIEYFLQELEYKINRVKENLKDFIGISSWYRK